MPTVWIHLVRRKACWAVLVWDVLGLSEIGDELEAKPTFWFAIRSNALERERWIFDARCLAELLLTVLAQSCGSGSLQAASAGAPWCKGLQFAKMPEDKAHLCLVWLK